MATDPDYGGQLNADTNSMRKKAWALGRWDIVAAFCPELSVGPGRIDRHVRQGGFAELTTEKSQGKSEL